RRRRDRRHAEPASRQSPTSSRVKTAPYIWRPAHRDGADHQMETNFPTISR
ncbi:Hypothetical predicted protein, partial [Pelobates cultripes]